MKIEIYKIKSGAPLDT